MRIEDMVVIREDGFEDLTCSPKKLIILQKVWVCIFETGRFQQDSKNINKTIKMQCI